MESKGQGTGMTFHFTIQCSALPPDISSHTLKYALFHQPGIEDPEAILSFLSNARRLQQIKLNTPKIPTGDRVFNGDAKMLRSLGILILLSNGTNERVIASHLEHLCGTHPVHKLIVHSKEEAREALTRQEVDCIILDLVSISAVETYLRNESTSGRTPAIVLLAPRSQMESETTKKWEQISSPVHFLGTPLRQLSLAYELQTILEGKNEQVIAEKEQEEEKERGDATCTHTALAFQEDDAASG